MSILFINGSPNKNGNTAALAAELLKDHEYETLNLTDYTIGAYGQNLPSDGLDTVIGHFHAVIESCVFLPFPQNCILCFRAQLRRNGCWMRASTP